MYWSEHNFEWRTSCMLTLLPSATWLCHTSALSFCLLLNEAKVKVEMCEHWSQKCHVVYPLCFINNREIQTKTKTWSDHQRILNFIVHIHLLMSSFTVSRDSPTELITSDCSLILGIWNLDTDLAVECSVCRIGNAQCCHYAADTPHISHNHIW